MEQPRDQEVKKPKIWIPSVIIVAGLIVLGTVWTASFSKAGLSRQDQTRKLDLQLKGLSCMSCKESLESSLVGLPGVIKVYADPKTNTGWIIYDPRKISKEEVLKANIFSVYPAKVIGDNPHTEAK